MVEAYLDNHLDRVKERTIGFEVFGREPAYDTNQDSVVRTTAAEVRKKLAQYYQEPGHEQELRVLLPQGSYLPEFRAAVGVAAPMVDAPPVANRWLARIGVAVSVLALVLLGQYFYSRAHATEIDRFWKPILDDRSDIVICVGQPLRIYLFEGPRAVELNEKMVGTLTTPAADPEVREKTSVNLSELRPRRRPVLLGRRLSGVGPARGVSGTAQQGVPGDRRPEHGL